MTMHENYFGKAAEQMNRQVDEFVNLVTFWQTQNQKAMDLWLEQSAATVKESQKLMKDWLATGNKVTTDFCKVVETNLKDAVRMYIPESQKAGKA